MKMVTINGRVISDYGAELMAGSYASLLTPAETKEWVSNDDPRKNGTEYIVPTHPVVRERQVDLIFGIVGDTKDEFLSKYNNFISLLQSGIIAIHVPDIGATYRLIYNTCTSFDHFGLTSCKVVVKFTEPDPTNRQ